jgi:hypothetical protein
MEELKNDKNNNYHMAKGNYTCSCCNEQTDDQTKFRKHVNSQRHKRVYWIVHQMNDKYDYKNKCFSCRYCHKEYKHWKDFTRHRNTTGHLSSEIGGRY